MKRLFLIALLTLPLPSPASDLIDIYRQAQEHDSTWAGARAGYRAKLEKATQGRALLLPTLGLSAGTSETDQQVTLFGSNNSYRYGTDSYALQLSQPLYRKQNSAAYAQGLTISNQAEHDLQQARQDLMLRVTQTYFAVLAAQDVLNFAVTEKDAIVKQLTLAKRNFSVGTATSIDVNEAQARYDIAAAQEITAANDLDVKQQSLRILTSALPAPLTPLLNKLELQQPQPLEMEKWVEIAQAGSPQVKSQAQTVEMARQELEKNRGGHYPTLDLIASHSYSDAGGSIQGMAIQSKTNQIGLLFQLPLYQGGGISSLVREAAAHLEEADQRLEQTRRQVAQQTRETYLAVISGVARVTALEQAQRSNERALQSTVIGYERGLRSGIDVLNAQRELFRTRRDLSQARYDYLINHLRLKATAGVLQEQDLEQINKLLGKP